MQIPTEAVQLRIYIGESDRWEHKPLYEAIVMAARAAHLAGATVLRGPMGFGKASRLHTAKILRLSMDLPLVIEIVDSEEMINQFLPVLDKMIGGGLVTLEKVRVLHYRSAPGSEAAKGAPATPAPEPTDFEKILRETLLQFHSETGTLHRLDEPAQLLQLVAHAGLPPQLIEVVKFIPVGKGIAGETAAKNRPVTLCNLQTDTSGVALPGAKQTGVGGALCVPVRLGGNSGKVVGTFGIGTVREYEYSAAEINALQDLANSLAAALHS